MSAHVRDVMTADPVTVGPDTGYKEVIDRLIEHDVGAVPVVDESGALVGIITESDLLTKPAYGEERRGRGRRTMIRALLGGRPPNWVSKAEGLTAAELMSGEVVTAAPWEQLGAVARRLVEHRIGRVPVVDDDRLVGIVSQRDLLRPFHRSDDEIAAAVGAEIRDPIKFDSVPNVGFSVHDGIVTLTGSVLYPRDIDTLLAVVRGVAGVVDIHNEVTAELPEPPPEPPSAPSEPAFVRPF